MARETFRIEIPIEVQDKTDPGITNAERKVSQFDKSIEKTKRSLDEFNGDELAERLARIFTNMPLTA